LSTPFASRLIEAIAQRNLSQSRLAEALGVSRSTITGWLRYGKLPDADLIYRVCSELHVSSDWLLGLDTHIEKHDPSGAIHWIEQIPPHVTGPQRDQIAYGIRLFNNFVTENRSAEEMQAAHDWRIVSFALQAALRVGAIRLTSVARSTDHERDLLKRFPTLKEVVVADVPQHCDNTIIRTEFVCFLAAVYVLTQIIRSSAVGLGSGYTMLRFCENSVPTVDQFAGTHWTPLLAFPSHNTIDYTADYLGRMMSIRHSGSISVDLVNSDKGHPPIEKLWEYTQTMFVSVSGVDRRDWSSMDHILAEFRSADYLAEAPDLRSSYAQLENKAGFGGELLRYLLDVDGNIIKRDSSVSQQVDLELLRYNSTGIGKVCIIAARRYKARAVLTCVRSRLANSLVIDSEIADYLLQNT
jgi:DNA-binding transcriptional regulator LsrR (DeoR family)